VARCLSVRPSVCLSVHLSHTCDRLRRHSRTLSARPIRGVRHSRPFHPAPSSAEVIWAKRLCTCVVRIISESTPTTRDTSWRRVSDDDYSVRCAAGQRTRSDTVRALHSRRSAPVQLHGLNVHQYADDTQIYGCCHPNNSASLCGDFGICVEDVARWMCSNRLQLNARKTEFMWCVPPRRRHQLPVDQLTIRKIFNDTKRRAVSVTADLLVFPLRLPACYGHRTTSFFNT